MAELVDIITQFRMATYEHCPYLAPYVYSLVPVERPGLGTMAVDKYGRLYFDPEFCERITLEQGAYVVLHEAWHLILRHCHRAPKIIGDKPSPKDHYLLNVAMDIVVFEMLEAIKKDCPEGGVTFDEAKKKWPEIERNMTIEQLYAIISEAETPPPQPDLPVPNEEEGEEEGPPGGDFHQPNDKETDQPADESEESDGSDGESETDGGDQEVDGKGRGKGPEGESKGGGKPADDEFDQDFDLIGGGSGADGIPRDYEEEPDPTWDAYREDRLLEEVEKQIEKVEEDRDWILGRGTIPAGLKRLIRQKLRPQPNPWNHLRATVAKCAANHRGAPDYTYRRINRRQEALPARLKGTQKYTPKAVVGVDSSGSMTAGCLRKAIGVIRDGLKALGEVPVVTCDARVGQDSKVTRIGDDFDFQGGGGTDLRVLLDYAESEHRPDVVVLVTDGGTPWPDRPTRYQLVIALTQECPTPSWATTVRIPDDPSKKEL